MIEGCAWVVGMDWAQVARRAQSSVSLDLGQFLSHENNNIVLRLQGIKE